MYKNKIQSYPQHLSEDIKILNFLRDLNKKPLINEQVIYSDERLKELAKRFGEDKETLDKLIVHSLHSPQFKGLDLFRANKEEFNNAFNNWYNNITANLLKKGIGIGKDNPTEYIEKYLDAYIDNIRSVGKAARPIGIRDAEISLIKLVDDNGWLDDDSEDLDKGEKTYNIDEPDDKDIIYQNDEILIVNGFGQKRCIMYGRDKNGKVQNWCISQTMANMYYDYRINHGGTIYFVLQKNKPEGKQRQLIIINYGNDMYGIADESNTGDFTASKSSSFKWAKIESIIPNLKNLEKYFPTIEITKDEKEYSEILENVYNDENIYEYVVEKTKNLTINNQKVKPLDFFNDYIVKRNGILPDNQFLYLWERRHKNIDIYNMIKRCLTTGQPLSEFQFKLILKGDK